MANIIRDLSATERWFEVLPSAARTTAPDTQEFVLDRRGYNPNGLIFTIDVTAIAATPSITVTVSGVDRVSGKLFTVLAAAAITATGTTVLKIGPAMTAAAGLVANDLVPSVFRVSVSHLDSDSITYSIGGMVA